MQKKLFPATNLRFRQIHLDFHTSPAIGDVGVDFDAEEFARTMKKAQVDSVTVFAKCHHGHLYYNTRHPARHPGLKKGLDLLGGQIAALHRQGIRAPVYLSVQCDEFAADTHPEWVARNPDGNTVGRTPLGTGWQILDMSSPYQDYLFEQLAEVLKVFKPVDGIFLDMCWDQPSVSQWAIKGMLAENLNPEIEADRRRYARLTAHRYMQRYFQQIKASAKDATVWFNSRPFAHFSQEAQYQTQVEIEALPTGGWGYMYFPMNVRFARNFGLPCLGMTARFHKSWADFGGLKPYAALQYETSQMLAHGARCSIGDQLHPRGALDPAVYDLIGRVYQRVEAREPWLHEAVAVAQIGVFQGTVTGTSVFDSSSRSSEGATRMLTQLRQQFDLVNVDSPLSRYKLLILPDVCFDDPQLLARLRAYLKSGGRLLASGYAGCNADASKALLPELGVTPKGPSPFATTYFRAGAETGDDLALTDHVIYDRTVRVIADKATAVSRIVEPYFDRNWRHFSSHAQTPGAVLSRFAAATVTPTTAYVAFPVFHSFATHGNVPYRLLVENLLRRLLPEPVLKVGGPSYVETTVTQQKALKRTIVHILAYSAERRTQNLDIIEDIVPLYETPVALKTDASPSRVYLAPEGTDLPFYHRDGYVHVTVPKVAGHAMIVFDGCAARL